MATPVLDNQLQVSQFKGLNTSRPADLIADEEFSRLTNCLVHRGIVKKRPGLTSKTFPYSVTPGIPPGTYGHLHFLGIDYGLSGFAVIPSLYFWDETTDDLYASLDGETLVKTNVASNITSMPTYIAPGDVYSQGPMFVGTVGGNAGLWRIPDESSWPFNPVLISTDTPSAEGIVLTHVERVWYFYEDRVIFSDPGDYTTLSTLTANFIEFPTDVLGATPLNDKIIILLLDGIYALNLGGTPKNWSLTKIHSVSTPVDQIIHEYMQTMVTVQDTVFVVSFEGLYRTNGVEAVLVSEPVEQLFFTGTGPAALNPRICLYSDSPLQLFIQCPRGFYTDPNDNVSRLVYNIEEDVWTKIEPAIFTPLTNPIYTTFPDAPLNIPTMFQDFFFVKQIKDITAAFPATYAQYVNQGNETRQFNGFYCMVGFDNDDENVLLHTPLEEEDWLFADYGSEYVTTIQTKTFDFGYKGINKKCNKVFLSISTREGKPVDLNVTPVVNDVDRTPIEFTVSTKRNFRIVGPGYFTEYAIKIDDENTALTPPWELQSFGLDLFNKAEQKENSGTAGMGLGV